MGGLGRGLDGIYSLGESPLLLLLAHGLQGLLLGGECSTNGAGLPGAQVNGHELGAGVLLPQLHVNKYKNVSRMITMGTAEQCIK